MSGSKSLRIDSSHAAGPFRHLAGKTRPIVNPTAWICFWSAIAFSGLAGLVVFLPSIIEHRGWLQVYSFLIAVTGIGLHMLLHVTVFANPESDRDHQFHSTVIDINRLERLAK